MSRFGEIIPAAPGWVAEVEITKAPHELDDDEGSPWKTLGVFPIIAWRVHYFHVGLPGPGQNLEEGQELIPFIAFSVKGKEPCPEPLMVGSEVGDEFYQLVKVFPADHGVARAADALRERISQIGVTEETDA